MALANSSGTLTMNKLTLSIFFCALGLLFSSSPCLAKKSPFTAGEDIEFLGKEDKALLDINKSTAFSGVLTRKDVKESDQRMLDVYEFSAVSANKMDKDLCQKLADQIFGPSTEISLKTTGQELFASPRSGQICEIILRDEDEKALFKERHFFAFITNNKAFGLVARFHKVPPKEKTKELRTFIKNLRTY
ncbi:hypothetical protein [Bdellovibrio sp.]|uniref:hypothetical protein n=1 Tax=Bdellovibrio sp. TaxID=28201 RepID=UPI0039E68AF5